MKTTKQIFESEFKNKQLEDEIKRKLEDNKFVDNEIIFLIIYFLSNKSHKIQTNSICDKFMSHFMGNSALYHLNKSSFNLKYMNNLEQKIKKIVNENDENILSKEKDYIKLNLRNSLEYIDKLLNNINTINLKEENESENGKYEKKAKIQIKSYEKNIKNKYSVKKEKKPLSSVGKKNTKNLENQINNIAPFNQNYKTETLDVLKKDIFNVFKKNIEHTFGTIQLYLMQQKNDLYKEIENLLNEKKN